MQCPGGESSPAALDQRGTFIVRTRNCQFVWNGAESPIFLQQEGLKYSRKLIEYEFAPEKVTGFGRVSLAIFFMLKLFIRAKVVEVRSGHETPEFWSSFRGVDTQTGVKIGQNEVGVVLFGFIFLSCILLGVR